MKKEEFVDFYALLEVSSTAESKTIERVFRYHAQQCHPDVRPDLQNPDRFRQLVEAHAILCDPPARAAYDVEYEKFQQYKNDIIRGAESTGSDSDERHRMLTIFYSQRRRDWKQPGVGIYTLEKILGCPMEVLEFHLWYFREKGWIQREESGLLSITALGVDQIEAHARKNKISGRYLVDKTDGSPEDSDAPNFDKRVPDMSAT